ncbi:MAG: hypothetical protein C9356_12170 [Oleiphilus sp.]|nr:MAG: hypothetical protein C9356_12170 [Oleiphilus sp.]
MQQQPLIRTIPANLHELTVEQASKVLWRKVETPLVSFDDYCRNEGYPGIFEKALNGLLAEVFLPCTRGSTSNHKKVSRGKKDQEKYEELKQAYADAVESGAIGTKQEYFELDLSRDCDMAHVRIALRRATQKALRKGLPVPEHNLRLVGAMKSDAAA